MHVVAYALDASRRMGELLQATERAKGAASGGTKTAPRGSYVEPRDTHPTLAEIGITKKESSRAQKLASLPDETFQKVKEGEIPVSKAIKAAEPCV